MYYCPECRAVLLKRFIGGAERLVCPAKPCRFVFWNNPTPVVGAIVCCNGQYILARNATWPEGLFSMITGFLEACEHPDVAIQRETQEELGLTPTQAIFLGHFVLERQNQLIMAYLVHAEGEVQLNDELVDYRLLTREELEQYDFGKFQLTAAIVKQALAHA